MCHCGACQPPTAMAPQASLRRLEGARKHSCLVTLGTDGVVRRKERTRADPLNRAFARFSGRRNSAGTMTPGPDLLFHSPGRRDGDARDDSTAPWIELRQGPAGPHLVRSKGDLLGVTGGRARPAIPGGHLDMPSPRMPSERALLGAHRFMTASVCAARRVVRQPKGRSWWPNRLRWHERRREPDC